MIIPKEKELKDSKIENEKKNEEEESKDFIKDILINLSKSILSKGSNEIYAKIQLNIK